MIAGTRLGLYEVIGPLGAGGMGEVYRARAFDQRDSYMFAMRRPPGMKPLLADPRAQQILERADAMRKAK